LGELLRKEAAKPSLAPSNYFVLTLWICVCVEELGKDRALWDKRASVYIPALAIALERTHSSGRRNLAHSATIATRRALRSVFRHGPFPITAVTEILTKKDASSTSTYAVLLGVVAGVSARNPRYKEAFADQKKSCLTFYTREIVGSKVPVSSHIAHGMDEFFKQFVSLEDLESDIIPPLEKALLRAPEIVLNNVVAPMISALGSFDISGIFQRLLKPLLANIKSTNPSIRNGVLGTFTALASKSSNPAILGGIADEILNPLKQNKVPGLDQKIIHADMLKALPGEDKLSVKISLGLVPVALKEANETALDHLLLALEHHLLHALDNKVEIDTSISDSFSKGLSDKRPGARRLWASHFGNVLWNSSLDALNQPQASNMISHTFDKVPALLKEVTANAVTAAQSGLATAASTFISVGLSSLTNVSDTTVKRSVNREGLLQSVVSWDGKPSFLFNPKVITKPTARDEIVWIIRALISVSGASKSFSAPKCPKQVVDAWSQAVVYFLTTKVAYEARLEFAGVVRDAFWRHPDVVGEILVQGIWLWLRDFDCEDKDSLAYISKSGKDRLFMVLYCLLKPAPEFTEEGIDVDKSVKEMLVNLLVLCQPPLIPGSSWIDICLNFGHDPGRLVEHDLESCIQRITESSKVRILNSNVFANGSSYIHSVT
jgi:hypothetical protein